MRSYPCHARINGGRHLPALYRITVGGYTFNACVRCTSAISLDAKRDSARFRAKLIKDA